MKISVLVPVYGAENILKESYVEFSKAVKKVTKDFEILFCIDGSPDNSEEVLYNIAREDMHVKVLCHRPNRGLGYTLRKLFEHANGDLVIYFDADAFLCFDLSFLPVMIGKIENFDAVIASRYFLNPLLPYHRWLASEIYYYLNKILFGISIRDIGSGFVLFKRSAISSINLVCDGFDIHTEIFVKLAKKGFKILEAPLAYKHWQGGSFRVFKHGPKIVADTFRLWRKL